MKKLANITLTFLLAGATAWAQGTAQIHGTVQDSSGSSVPGAQVKVTQTETGASRTAASGADGGYVLTNLPIGPYQIEVTKEGFAKAVQTGVVLQVNADPAIEIALKVGAVSEQVKVEANATLVETRNSGIGSVTETQRIVELPLNGRQVTDLVALNGLDIVVVDDGSGDRTAEVAEARGAHVLRLPFNLGIGGAVQTGSSDNRIFSGRPFISIGGMASLPIGGGATDWLLDGASHYDFMSGTTLPISFPDAVQEFKVETSGLAAARGNNSSVEIVTRSGTNSLHGSLFEFIRNDGFGSAREYLATKDSTYKRHQFGGVVGGAIKKNKLFFFGGAQETTQRASPNSTIAFFPTQAMVNGDFTAFESAACGRPAPLAAPFGTGGFGTNRVNPALLAAPALYITDKFGKSLAAVGVTPDPCGKITYNTPVYQNNYEFVQDRLSDRRQSLAVFPRSVQQRAPAHLDRRGAESAAFQQHGI